MHYKLLALLTALLGFTAGCSNMDARVSYQVTGERAPGALDRQLALGVKEQAPESPDGYSTRAD